MFDRCAQYSNDFSTFFYMVIDIANANYNVSICFKYIVIILYLLKEKKDKKNMFIYFGAQWVV